MNHLPAFAIAVAFALPAAPALAADAPPRAQTRKPGAKAPPRKAVVAAAPLPPAGDEQKAAAAAAHLGEYSCEFNQVVNVAGNAKAEGYIDVTHKAQTWVMKPVLSSTGALRLEDVLGRMLMIQIANKSMVMDTQAGQRVVDGCQHEKQREFERSYKPSAPDALLRQ
jgi:hypothetical protein